MEIRKNEGGEREGEKMKKNMREGGGNEKARKEGREIEIGDFNR